MDTAFPPTAYDVFHPNSPSRRAFDQVFSRWGILVLIKLSLGPQRFGTLRRLIGGISEKMLAQTVKVLEEEGLVVRQEWDEKPPRVEYRLSDPGRRVSAGLTTVIGDLYAALDQRASTPAPPDR